MTSTPLDSVSAGKPRLEASQPPLADEGNGAAMAI